MARWSRWLIVLLLALPLFGCFDNFFVGDGATRLAGDLRDGAAKLKTSGLQYYVVIHRPKAGPEGCESNYSVQFVKDSVLAFWCKDPRTGEVTGSGTTTYHLRFVKVPKGYMVDKHRGEPLSIELERQGDAVIVANVQ